MSEKENSEMRDEEDKETDTRTESTSMEETEGQDKDLRRSESDGRTDRRQERDPRSWAEKREKATHEVGQRSGYPVRTGVADCYFYLKNGRCGYGQSCRFNHPVRPQLPERSQMRHEVVQPSPYPGARDCRQYVQTGQCSYGPKCRFNHPPPPVLPQTVSRQNCKKGSCKYGSDCKFTHSMRGDGAEPMHQTHGAASRSRPWKRERHAHYLEEQKQKKRKVAENRRDNAQANLQEQADMERQNREAQEKAQEERRQQIENERREARLRLDQMRHRALTGNVDQVRRSLKDIGIKRKEGDGF